MKNRLVVLISLLTGCSEVFYSPKTICEDTPWIDPNDCEEHCEDANENGTCDQSEYRAHGMLGYWSTNGETAAEVEAAGGLPEAIISSDPDGSCASENHEFRFELVATDTYQNVAGVVVPSGKVEFFDGTVLTTMPAECTVGWQGYSGVAGLVCQPADRAEVQARTGLVDWNLMYECHWNAENVGIQTGFDSEGNIVYPTNYGSGYFVALPSSPEVAYWYPIYAETQTGTFDTNYKPFMAGYEDLTCRDADWDVAAMQDDFYDISDRMTLYRETEDTKVPAYLWWPAVLSEASADPDFLFDSMFSEGGWWGDLYPNWEPYIFNEPDEFEPVYCGPADASVTKEVVEVVSFSSDEDEEKEEKHQFLSINGKTIAGIVAEWAPEWQRADSKVARHKVVDMALDDVDFWYAETEEATSATIHELVDLYDESAFFRKVVDRATPDEDTSLIEIDQTIQEYSLTFCEIFDCPEGK